MADQKISQLTTIVTVDTASDLFPIVDTSASETKKITPSALKTALALNNVDNTSDANKPISSATQTALDAKQATLVSGTNIKTVNNTSLLGSGNITIAGGGGTWGSITGTLSNQTDLQTALDGKVDENTAITGATKTKITYDAKGLVTAGADATTADIADSTNKRYVTDANLTVIQNTSGTNTGDNAVNSLYSGLATSKQDTLVSGTNIKTVNSTSLLGSGDVAVQATLVSGTNIKTINSTSLLGSGDITISASPSGVSGAIQFSNGSAFASDAANLFWDDTNNRLGVGTNAPTSKLQIVTDDATNPQAFGNQTTVMAGSASQGALISAFSSTNGAFLNALWPGNAWFKMNYGGTNHTFSTSGTVMAVIDTNTTFGNGTTTLGARVGIKGSGSTSATTSLLVQNSAGTAALTVTDGLSVVFGGAISSTSGQSQVFNGTFYNNSTDRNNFGGAISVNTFACIGAQRNAVASAVLEVVSTSKGFLPPVMTTTQKNAIASPAAGLVLYDSTTNKLQCYNGSTWNDLF